jgi:hypothetical protein
MEGTPGGCLDTRDDLSYEYPPGLFSATWSLKTK